MLYIYIEIRYKKQLEKIHSSSIERLNDALERVCIDHGGEILRQGSVLFAGFDEKRVGYLFGAARSLLTIQTGLDSNKKWVGEYVILADSADDPEEDIFQNMRSSSNKILREDGIFCFPAAARCLAEYLVFEEDVFPRVIGSRIKPESAAGGGKNSGYSGKASRYPILSGKNEKVLTALRNCFGMLPRNEIAAIFTDEERAAASELQYAMESFQRSRFDAQIPDYIKQSVIELCRLYFRGAVTLAVKNRRSVSFYLQSPECIPEGSVPEEFIPGEFIPQLRELCSPIPVHLISPEEDEDACSFEEKLKSIPRDLLEIGYLIFRAAEYLYIDELYPFFAHLGKKKVYLDSALEYLRGCGLLEGENRLAVPNFSRRESLIRVLADRCGALDMYLGDFLWQKYCSRTLTPGFWLYKTLADLKTETSESFLLSCIYAFLEEEPWTRYPELLSEESLAANLRVTPEQAARILGLIRCRELVLSGAAGSGGELTEYGEHTQEGRSLLECAIALECGRWYYAAGMFSRAMNTVKNVLQKFQVKKNRQGEYSCFALLALIKLAEGHISDSMAYFEYANDCADSEGGLLYHLRGRCNLAMIHFIEGNFSRCIKILNADMQNARELFDRNILVFIMFFRGRSFFELGDYERAQEDFARTRELAQEMLLPDAVNLAHVWQGRVLGCRGRRVEAERIFMEYMKSVPDAFVFYAESCILNDRGTISAADVQIITDMYSRQPLWYGEHFTWTSGFRFAEDFCYVTNSKGTAGVCLLRAFYAYYSGASDELRKIIQNEQISGLDPYIYLYTFLLYLAEGKGKTSTELDRTTLLSRAFKLVQKRANHIDEIGVRAEFLKKPVWNSLLYSEARKNMLI